MVRLTAVTDKSPNLSCFTEIDISFLLKAKSKSKFGGRFSSR